jgi:hypothetical protein
VQQNRGKALEWYKKCKCWNSILKI